jgi:hypothetical protein
MKVFSPGPWTPTLAGLAAALIFALACLAHVVPVFGASGFQQQSPSLGSFKPPKASATNRVSAIPPRIVTVLPGGKGSAELEFEVKPGFHINSNKPSSDLLIATEVKLSPPTNVSIAGVQYPPGHDFSMPAAPGDKLNVYTGDFTVTATVMAATNTPPGHYRVHGFLEYQACDDRACYPPAKLPVSFDVRVARATRHRR